MTPFQEMVATILSTVTGVLQADHLSMALANRVITVMMAMTRFMVDQETMYFGGMEGMIS